MSKWQMYCKGIAILTFFNLYLCHFGTINIDDNAKMCYFIFGDIYEIEGL